MSSNPLGDALHQYNALREQLDENLLGEDGLLWSEQLRQFLHKQSCWVGGQPAQPLAANSGSALLQPVSTIPFPASGGFTANEKLIVNTSEHAKPRISYLWENFRPWFIEKNEPPLAAHTLCCHELRKPAVDIPIIEELGGEKKCETTLAELFFLIEKQSSGGDGILLNNCGANIFYIRDGDGVLRAAFARWDVVGWYLHAFPIGHPFTWETGYRVFSRQSAVEPVVTPTPPPA